MSSAVKYFYKGNDTDLIVFAKSQNEVESYLKEPRPDKLNDVVEVFEVYTTTNGKGAKGELGTASKAQIENEFGKKMRTEDVIDVILKEGQCNGEMNIPRVQRSMQVYPL
ncbi:hypothetical protein KAFR_0D04840 [Kazachstania africana CBS 2517]|uniref:Ribosome maturation protein SDO1/SBDS N-terminal domain-containing protein n=1 Tax=Kazachstania africana (strain ATCC 22294 / BCRC 22015 / CBS 2517 / CECT 1963 / NBRC 1671 / NRRL Y-8276) TaxID=1071382 RepID=H2AUT1_KAZAF|nr:hypothetical protein KAFR_0D04840 [Kazachstania africana CBS 2517]CCF58131.1 hypothetical protein KAFR_0D04840 [Kazachstania africana CBS 2517]